MKTQSIDREPWAYWPARVREEVALLLTKLLESETEAMHRFRWHEFPVLRSDSEDLVRALTELRRVVSVTTIDAVPMGEESAP